VANIYKNANYNLTTTDVTDIYTCPSNRTAIIKKIHCVNYGTTAIIKVFLYDSSNTTQYQFAERSIVTGSSSETIGDGVFILEENDVLRLQAASVDTFSGTIAILEIFDEKSS